MSAVFNGTSALLSIASAIVATPPFSFAIHMKKTSGAVGKTVIGLGSSSQNDSAIAQPWNDGQCYVSSENGGAQSFGSVAYSTGVWVPVVVIFPDSTHIRIYVAGTDSGLIANSTLPDALDRTVIGAKFQSGSASQFFDGNAAEAAYWSSALSGGDVTSYSGGTAASGISAGTLALYESLLSGAGAFSNTNVTFNSGDHPTITGGGGGGSPFRRRFVFLGA